MKNVFGISLSFVAVLMICQLRINEAALTVRCETARTTLWPEVGFVSACFMRTTTTIDAPGYIIDPEHLPLLKAVTFYTNKKIHFLPVEMSQAFTDLVVISASECSIRSIFKKNFEGLTSLKYLWLAHNQIVAVPSDAFDDLEALVQLSLGEEVLFEGKQY